MAARVRVGACRRGVAAMSSAWGWVIQHMVGDAQDFQVAVLGEIEVHVGGTPVALGHQQAVLVAVLAANRGEVVSSNRLIESLWGDRLPADPAAALRSLVSRLRKTVGVGASRLVSEASGYRLRLDRAAFDAACFEDLLARAHAAAGVERVACFDDALALWRGAAFGSVQELEELRADALALEEAREAAREQRAAVLVGLGRSVEAIADLEALLADHPQREHGRALLMEALAATGRPTDALAVYRRWSDELAERGLEPSPQLRAAESTILRHAGVAAVPRWRSMLPRPVSSLVGRDADVAALCGLVEDHRLVSLVGVGGVGKTRLALAVADQLLARFPGGIWFCDLAPAGSAAEVVDIVATTVGLVEQGTDPLLLQLTRFLHGGPCLVVLDNCERVTSGAAQVAEALTAHTSNMSLLATSRQRLGADGEYVAAVSPLPTGGPDSAAAQLFAERWAAVGGGTFPPTAGDRDAVSQLCRRLEGLPLAIELAAALARGISLTELLAQVQHRLDVLVDRQRGHPRHRSLTALIDWSHHDLDDSARAAFRRLGVFRSSFTLDAATDLLARTGIDPATVPDVLIDLVDRSLLLRTTEFGTSRYRALDSIREYMLSQLERAAETAPTMAAHAQWAACLAEQAEIGLASPAEARWAAVVYHQFDDLRAAVDWSIANCGDEALRIVAALHLFAAWRSESEIYRWAERAATAASAPRCAALPAGFAAAASGAWQRGDLATASRMLAAGYEQGVSRRLCEVAGDLALLTGDLPEAAERYGEARDLALSEGDLVQAVWDEGSRALAYAYGHDGCATAAAENARCIAEETGSPSAIAYAHYVLAETLTIADPERARRHLTEAATAAEHVGSTYLAALVGLSDANLAARANDPSAALDHFERLLTTWQQTASGTALAVTIRSLVTALVEVGELEGAARLHGAVTNPKIGPVPYGDDAERLETAGHTLRSRLGPRFDELSGQGQSLDEDELASEALRHVRLARTAASAHEHHRHR